VVERLAPNGDLQFIHPGTVCLQHFAGDADLIEAQEPFLVQSAPCLHPPLEGAQLIFLIFSGMFFLQPFENGFCFQRGGVFQHGCHFVPDCGEDIRAGAVVARLVHLAGKFSRFFIFRHRLSAAQICFDGCLFLGFALGAFFHQ